MDEDERPLLVITCSSSWRVTVRLLLDDDQDSHRHSDFEDNYLKVSIYTQHIIAIASSPK